jgi:hypothetical protein
MNAAGYFRISLTASDAMVARALPAFSEVTPSPHHQPMSAIGG